MTADGAFDTRRHTAIIERGATAILPIRRNGRPWTEDCSAAQARNESLRASRSFGRACLGNAGPGITPEVGSRPGCGASKPQAKRIAPRDPDRQTAELHTRLAPMNRFSALGRAEIVRTARTHGQEATPPQPELHNNAAYVS